MSVLFSDTRPEAEAVLLALLRQAPAQRKLEMVGQLNRAACALALAGLRQRYAEATPGELRRHLAGLLLGPELAARVADLSGNEVNPITEPVAVTLLVIEALDVPYFIGGSLASALYGVVRTTLDADLVADLRPEHAEPFARRLSAAFYVDLDSILDAIQRRDSFNVIHLESMFKVDIFIPRQRPYDRAQFARRVEKIVAVDAERAAYFASAEDTILAKLDWYRQESGVSERQWRDVLGVLKTQSGRLDLDYLRRWAAELSVADLLERALGEMEAT